MNETVQSLAMLQALDCLIEYVKQTAKSKLLQMQHKLNTEHQAQASIANQAQHLQMQQHISSSSGKTVTNK